MNRTRDETRKFIAIYLAGKDKYTWQLHPNAAQARKQDGYMQRANEVIRIVETNQLDYQWKPQG